MVEIFGENLLDKISLIPLMKQLSGLASEKPFECVGTIDEVNSALSDLWYGKKEEELPVLLQHHREYTGGIRFMGVDQQMNYWDAFNSLSEYFSDMLKESLEKAVKAHKK